jgi:hypothetical protein
MASMRGSLASAGASERHDNVVPAYVLIEKRRQRAERQKRVASTIVAGAIEEAAS